MKKQEILRRLGVPQFRHQCGQCRAYVPKLVAAFDMTQSKTLLVQCCKACAKKIDERNVERMKESVRNKLDYDRANHEYRAAMDRPSNYEYLAACEQMKREMGLK